MVQERPGLRNSDIRCRKIDRCCHSLVRLRDESLGVIPCRLRRQIVVNVLSRILVDKEFVVNRVRQLDFKGDRHIKSLAHLSVSMMVCQSNHCLIEMVSKLLIPAVELANAQRKTIWQKQQERLRLARPAMLFSRVSTGAGIPPYDWATN